VSPSGSGASGAGRPVVPGRSALTPLALSDVTVGPGFWGDRQQLNGDVILDHCRGWMERLGWVENFRVVAGRSTADRRGREFSDADVYKLVEALCWEAGRTGRSDLDDAIVELGTVFAAAQEPDGYLNTCFGGRGVDARYRDLEWGHELYCFGHLLQAGVARLRTGGDESDPLVATTLRAADHMCATFGADGHQGVDGHPVVEMGLVELFRATGRERYLAQAQRFVERRGRPALADIELGRAYFQDDIAVRDARVLRGHAVRALYLASGAVDVAVETGDGELLEAVIAQWDRTIAARTYLTGGMGSRHTGESFGEDWELPPDRAYAETCAGVAAVMVAWRLLLATGEPRFADVAERILCNVVAAAVARDGRSFFYANPLRVRVAAPVPDPARENPRVHIGMRSGWFHTACCPPNVARLLASLSAYVATTDGASRGVQLHQLVPGVVRARLSGGAAVLLRIATDYPWSGQVTVTVEDTPAEPWQLTVRVPPWAHGATSQVRTPGEPTSSHPVGDGDRHVSVTRPWRPGDELLLDLPMSPRWTHPDPRIDAIRGTAAVERGPLVYCAESTTPADDLETLTVDPTSDPIDLAPDPDSPLDGAVTVTVEAAATPPPPPTDWPYTPTAETPEPTGTHPRPLVPYHAWSNRGPSTMRVWLPVRPK
jgi:uncharacterized protein